jgi:hypothetical protein
VPLAKLVFAGGDGDVGDGGGNAGCGIDSGIGSGGGGDSGDGGCAPDEVRTQTHAPECSVRILVMLQLEKLGERLAALRATETTETTTTTTMTKTTTTTATSLSATTATRAASVAASASANRARARARAVGCISLFFSELVEELLSTNAELSIAGKVVRQTPTYFSQVRFFYLSFFVRVCCFVVMRCSSLTLSCQSRERSCDKHRLTLVRYVSLFSVCFSPRVYTPCLFVCISS